MFFMRILMYSTAIFLPAGFGWYCKVPHGWNEGLFCFVAVAVAIGFANAHMYRERQEGRAILNHWLAFNWGWLLGIVGFANMISGAFLRNALNTHDELFMAIAYALLGLSIAAVEKVLEEEPSYGWSVWGR